MKPMVWILVCVCFLSGCSQQQKPLEQGLTLRQQLLASEGCRFVGEITADYGDKLYAFTLECQGDSQGNVTFQVTAPDTICGISGKLAAEQGKLSFSGTELAFPMMAQGMLSPVGAPWVFLNTLRSGYVRLAGEDGDYLWLTIHDSYREDALQLDIWLDKSLVPVRCEFLQDGRRFLTMDVKSFQLL